MLFEAIPPDKMLQTLTKQFEEKVDTLRRKQKELRSWLISIMGKGLREEPSIEHFHVVRSGRRNNYWEKVREIFRLAKQEIAFAGTGYDFQEALNAAKRGVRIRGLIEVDRRNLSGVISLRRLQKVSDVSEVRHNGHVPMNYVIRDEEELILNPASGRETGEYGASLWTDSRAFIRAMRESFEEYWRASIPATRKARELQAGLSEVDLDHVALLQAMIAAAGPLAEELKGRVFTEELLEKAGRSLSSKIDAVYKRSLRTDRFTVEEYANVIIDLENRLGGELDV
jgi:sugar-specific transcriptional regulator TrmB